MAVYNNDNELESIVCSLTSLDLTVSSWERVAQGLFDYEDTSVQQLRIRVESSAKLKIDSSSGLTVCEPGKLNSHKELASITVEHYIGVREPCYTLRPSQEKQISSTHTYLVVRSLKNSKGQQKGFVLDKGDTIKLGRLQFLIIEYRDDLRTHSLRQTCYMDDTQIFNAPDEIEQGVCKFCLSEEVTEDNFLCSPCDCKGSCMMVHVQCLKAWISNKIKKQPNGIATQYNFTKYKCQLCSVPFPFKIVKKGLEIVMWRIEKPSKPYIVLESLSEETTEKILYLITQPCSGQTICLGRNHSCQIKMTDISVSRLHAHIKYQNKRFVLFDNKSKFGTLVKVNRPIRFTQDQIAFQFGRSVLAGSIKKQNEYVGMERKAGGATTNRLQYF